jgi:hypothetical protein
VGSWDRNNIGSVLEEAMTRFAVMQRQTEERFRVWMEKLTRLDSDDEDEPRKFRVEIKPVQAAAGPQGAAIDELKASIGSIVLSPSALVRSPPLGSQGVGGGAD